MAKPPCYAQVATARPDLYTRLLVLARRKVPPSAEGVAKAAHLEAEIMQIVAGLLGEINPDQTRAQLADAQSDRDAAFLAYRDFKGEGKPVLIPSSVEDVVTELVEEVLLLRRAIQLQ